MVLTNTKCFFFFFLFVDNKVIKKQLRKYRALHIVSALLSSSDLVIQKGVAMAIANLTVSKKMQSEFLAMTSSQQALLNWGTKTKDPEIILSILMTLNNCASFGIKNRKSSENFWLIFLFFRFCFSNEVECD